MSSTPETIDWRARLAEFSKGSNFNEWLGLEIVGAEPGIVIMHLRARPEFNQHAGFLHAGVIAGLLDTACGFAASSVCGNLLASQFSVRCLRPAIAEAFVVRGRLVKPGRKQVFAEADLCALGGDPEKPFAVADALLVPID